MNRRQFLKSTLFTTIGAVVLSACKKVAKTTKSLVDKVSTRKFLKGKKEEISLLGFGAMRLPILNEVETDIDQKKVEEMVDYAMEHGINYYDTAYFYHRGESEKAMGKALKKYPRDSFYFVTKMPLAIIQSKQQAEQIFEEQLKKCQTDYFDFYLAHNINKREWKVLKECNVYEQLLQKKKEGKIKYLGFSIHDTPELLEEVVNTYKWDFVQLPINPIDWTTVDAKRQYDIATKAGIPIVVMNPLKGGQLSTLTEKAVEILKAEKPSASPSSWSLRYSASLPNVFVVLSGMSELEQVIDNVKTFINFKPLSQNEQAVLSKAINVYNSSGAVSCTYCQYCTGCPVGIDIPKNFLIYNQYKSNNRKDRFIIAYETIKEENRADKCINCGICKNKCPQKLDIPSLLKEVSNVYKSLK